MKNHIIITLTFISMNLLTAKGIDLGSPAPQVNALNQNNETVDLGSEFAEGLTVVFFYPKADTPGCTAQACSLRDSFHELVEQGVKIYGVSYDSPEKQAKFIEKYSLPFDLIADEDKAVSKAFDRGGFFSREAYIIKDGEVIWRDLKASTRTQAADIKQALMDLGIASFASMAE